MKKLSILLVFCFIFATGVCAFETSTQYTWSGWKTDEDVEFPEGSGKITKKIQPGNRDDRNLITLSDIPAVSGNYTFSYEIYFESDIQTTDGLYYDYPKIITTENGVTGIKIEGSSIYFVAGEKKIPISLSKEKWYKFLYTFYPSSKKVSLSIYDGTNEINVSDADGSTMFPIECSAVKNLEFFRELRGIPVVAYFYNPMVESFVSVSLKSDVYDVSEDEMLIRKVMRNTGVDEFFNNIVVTDAEYKLFDKDGVEKTSGLMADGDYVVLSDGTSEYIYKILLNGYSVESDFYNVDNTEFIIRGIKENTTKADFLNNLIIIGGEKKTVSAPSGEISDTDIIKNGYTFYITDGETESVYTLKTDKTEDFIYFNDDYEDKSKSGWSHGSVKKEENGNSYYSIDLSSAHTTSKTISNSRMSDLFVAEFDVFYPAVSDYSSAIRGIYFNTPEDKIIMSLRTDTSGNLVTLDGPTATPVYNSIVGKWHNIKMVADNTSKTFDIYVDSKVAGTSYAYQAESNFIPRITKFSIDKAESGDLKLDNFTVYEPYPILMSKISFVKDENESFNVNNVKTDTDMIKIYFSVREDMGIIKESFEDNVSLLDSKGNEVSFNGSFNEDENIYTLFLNEVLNEDERYTVSIKNIKDDYYNKKYSDKMSFSSEQPEVKIKNAELVSNDVSITLEAEIKSNVDYPVKVNVVAACYSSDNRLTGLTYDEYTLNAYGSLPGVFDIITDNSDKVKYVKVYIINEYSKLPSARAFVIEK